MKIAKSRVTNKNVKKQSPCPYHSRVKQTNNSTESSTIIKQPSIRKLNSGVIKKNAGSNPGLAFVPKQKTQTKQEIKKVQRYATEQPQDIDKYYRDSLGKRYFHLPMIPRKKYISFQNSLDLQYSIGKRKVSNNRQELDEFQEQLIARKAKRKVRQIYCEEFQQINDDLHKLDRVKKRLKLLMKIERDKCRLRQLLQQYNRHI